MTARWGGRRTALLGMVASACVLVGCFAKPKHPVPAPLPVTLEIVSHAFADVDVYVLPSPSASGMRLTTVSGFSKATVRLRPLQLQPGGVLQLELHAIGTTTQWVTAALPVSPGDHVMLEINSDATGNLSRTVLYPLPNPDGGDAPMPSSR